MEGYAGEEFIRTVTSQVENVSSNLAGTTNRIALDKRSVRMTTRLKRVGL